jgi:hypothetical protein
MNIKCCIIVHNLTNVPFILSHRKLCVKVYSVCLVGGFELSEYGHGEITKSCMQKRITTFNLMVRSTVCLLTHCHYVDIDVCIHSTIKIFRFLANTATCQWLCRPLKNFLYVCLFIRFTLCPQYVVTILLVILRKNHFLLTHIKAVSWCFITFHVNSNTVIWILIWK